MTAHDVLRRVTGALERAGIAYMLTGSYASSYHGTPRATQDLDIVISASQDQMRAFAKLLPGSEYYMPLDAALAALSREGMFNIMDLETGWKVDFIAQKSRPFSRVEFDRKLAVEIDGTLLSVASAEDVIVSKLEWAKRSESERQVEDAAGIWRIRAKELDREYIENWVRELGLQEQWDAARRAGGDVN